MSCGGCTGAVYPFETCNRARCHSQRTLRSRFLPFPRSWRLAPEPVPLPFSQTKNPSAALGRRSFNNQHLFMEIGSRPAASPFLKPECRLREAFLQQMHTQSAAAKRRSLHEEAFPSRRGCPFTKRRSLHEEAPPSRPDSFGDWHQSRCLSLPIRIKPVNHVGH